MLEGHREKIRLTWLLSGGARRYVSARVGCLLNGTWDRNTSLSRGRRPVPFAPFILPLPPVYVAAIPTIMKSLPMSRRLWDRMYDRRDPRTFGQPSCFIWLAVFDVALHLRRWVRRNRDSSATAHPGRRGTKGMTSYVTEVGSYIGRMLTECHRTRARDSLCWTRRLRLRCALHSPPSSSHFVISWTMSGKPAILSGGRTQIPT